MSAGAPSSYEWHEDDIRDNHPALDRMDAAGERESWRIYDLWVAITPYSGLWLLESWISGGSALGEAGLIHMAYGLATLLLAVAACTALYKAWERTSKRLAVMIVAVSGIAMLAAHRA